MEEMRNEKKTKNYGDPGFFVDDSNWTYYGFSSVLDGKVIADDTVRDLSKTYAMVAESNSVGKLCRYHDNEAIRKVDVQLSFYCSF